jgi:hypothetical protein
MEDLPFPEQQSYKLLVEKPASLEDINATEGQTLQGISESFDVNGNLIKDIINTRLDTAAKQILGEFVFGASGAIKIIIDANNGIWLSPTGILGKKAGANTFSLGIDGTANYYGPLAASQITTGTLVVARTEAKCTNPNADQTSLNTAADTAKVQGYTLIAGGYLQTVYINANYITAGTLTAIAFKTANSGLHIEIPANDGLIYFYNGATPVAYLYADPVSPTGLGLAASQFKIGCPELTQAIFPVTANTYACGGAGLYWYAVYSHYYYAQYTSFLSFQHHDDIALIKNIKSKIVKEPSMQRQIKKGQEILVQGKSMKKEVWDIDSLPEEVKEGEFIKTEVLHGLTIGALKQLIEKVEILEQKVDSKLK